MNDKVKLKCPRCGHKWEKSLREMERVEEVFRDAKEKPKDKTVKYRTQCPNDGTYVIVDVEE